MSISRMLAGVTVVLLSATLSSAAVEIDHAGVQCVVAGQFPQLTARLAPADGIARARVLFQPPDTTFWYAVAMKAEGESFAGVLPRPTKSLKAFRYYIEATDSAFATARTPEYETTVVDGPAGCKGGVVGTSLGSASVLLEAPAGAPAVPPGFAAAGVAAGAAAATGVAVGAAGGGIGAGTIILIGAGAAAAGTAAVVAGSAGSEEGGRETGPPPGAPPIRLNLVMAPFIDVGACRSGLTFGGGVLSLAADGSFNETWSPTTPNTLRLVGRATEASIEGTLSCVSGSGTGSVNATGSGYNLQGTWSFTGRSGPLTVTRAQ